jgi:hypothetical protein
MSATSNPATSTQVDKDSTHAQPWYRYPLVWLVISGPFIVVIAALYSASIAYRGADLLVQDQRDATREHALRDVSEDQQGHPNLLPADKVRKMGASAGVDIRDAHELHTTHAGNRR